MSDFNPLNSGTPELHQLSEQETVKTAKNDQVFTFPVALELIVCDFCFHQENEPPLSLQSGHYCACVLKKSTQKKSTVHNNWIT